jgi:hypothetical protein
MNRIVKYRNAIQDRWMRTGDGGRVTGDRW